MRLREMGGALVRAGIVAAVLSVVGGATASAAEAAAEAGAGRGGERRGGDPWDRDRERRLGPALLVYGDLGALFFADAPRPDLGGGVALAGRGVGTLPIFHAEAHFLGPGGFPMLWVEVGGGIYTAHKPNVIGGLEAAVTLGLGEEPTWPGIALRPWLGAEVDFGEALTLIAVHFTIGVTGAPDAPFEEKVLNLGFGFRIGAPWPKTPYRGWR